MSSARKKSDFAVSRKRHERQVRLTLPASNVAEVTALVERHKNPRFRSRRLRARVTPDGMLIVWFPSTQVHAPPRLIACLVPGDDCVILDGAIRETWTEAVRPYLFGGLAIWTLGLAATGVATGGSLMGLLVLLPGAMFAGLGYWTGRDRASQFDCDCRMLVDAVASLMRPRRGHRRRE